MFSYILHSIAYLIQRNMYSKTLIFLGVIALVHLCHGYSKGAPKEVCDDMTPQHKVGPQKTRSPYVIRMSKTKIHAGESTDITISGKAGESIKGFLIQARVGATPLGQFSSKGNSKDIQFIDCGSGSKNAATHTGSEDKKEITVTWTAPPVLSEQVIFYATVAKNGGEYWVKQKSRTLTVV